MVAGAKERSTDRWPNPEPGEFATMTNSTQPRTWVRAINTAFAVALAVFVLASYWPIVKVFELARADLRPSISVNIAHAPAIKTPGRES
jgi:hypothetical protein